LIALRKLVYPKTKQDVRSFLGMVGYYRSFIPDFAGIATPLLNTLFNHQPDTITLTQEIQQSVDILKQQLWKYPVLQFRNLNEQFILETDASDIRISTILMQLQQGNKVIISGASRTLTSANENYGVVEREALAIVYGIKYFRPYLFGSPFW